MLLLPLTGTLLCLLTILEVRPLRRCARQLVARWQVKRAEYTRDPKFYAAQRTWGQDRGWPSSRNVNGKQVDTWQVLPEQIESKRYLKQLLPKRTPNDQSIWWTIIFYGILGLLAGCAFDILVELIS